MHDRGLPRYGAPGSSWTGLSAAIMWWFIPATLAERSPCHFTVLGVYDSIGTEQIESLKQAQ